MKKRSKVLSLIFGALVLSLSLVSVNAASLSKTKVIANDTYYGTVYVSDKATKNNVTGSWTFSVGASGSISSGFACSAYASKLGTNPILTNNGNNARHSTVYSVYRTSSGQNAGGGMCEFTFTYNPSTNQVY